LLGHSIVEYPELPIFANEIYLFWGSSSSNGKKVALNETANYNSDVHLYWVKEPDIWIISTEKKEILSLLLFTGRYIINGLPGEPEFGRNNWSQYLNQIKNRLCWLLVMTFFSKNRAHILYQALEQTTKKRDRWNSATLRHSTRAHHLLVRHAHHIVCSTWFMIYSIGFTHSIH
jgi:hypothetical protein